MNCAKRAILKYNPGIIAITGGLGKTMTQAALCGVLYDIRSLHATNTIHESNMRIPFAIVLNEKKGSGFFFWMQVILNCIKIRFFAADYPELLVLTCPEGESNTLLTLARPQIVIMTALEKENKSDAIRLITALPSNGYAVVNHDDTEVKDISERTRAREITFGFNEGADLMMSNLTYRSEKTQGEYKPVGISFAVKYGTQSSHALIASRFNSSSSCHLPSFLGTVPNTPIIRFAGISSSA